MHLLKVLHRFRDNAIPFGKLEKILFHLQICRSSLDKSRTVLLQNPSKTKKEGDDSHFVAPKPRGTWLDRQVVGNFRCGGCIACPYMQTGKTFTSNVTGKIYNIRKYINCKSTGVIYKVTCKCGLEYVGKTYRELCRRVGKHLGDISHRRDKPLATALRFMGIDTVLYPTRGDNWDKLILQREARWTFTLDTIDPNGLNDQIVFSPFL